MLSWLKEPRSQSRSAGQPCASRATGYSSRPSSASHKGKRHPARGGCFRIRDMAWSQVGAWLCPGGQVPKPGRSERLRHFEFLPRPNCPASLNETHTHRLTRAHLCTLTLMHMATHLHAHTRTHPWPACSKQSGLQARAQGPPSGAPGPPVHLLSLHIPFSWVFSTLAPHPPPLPLA